MTHTGKDKGNSLLRAAAGGYASRERTTVSFKSEGGAGKPRHGVTKFRRANWRELFSCKKRVIGSKTKVGGHSLQSPNGGVKNRGKVEGGGYTGAAHIRNLKKKCEGLFDPISKRPVGGAKPRSRKKREFNEMRTAAFCESEGKMA